MADPLSIITSIITLLDTAKKAYNKVQDATHLPQAFERISQRINLAIETLFEVRQKFQKDTEEEAKITGTLQECEKDAQDLKTMYETVSAAANADWLRRYKGYISNMVHDRKGKVEDVWKRLLEGLEVLQGYHLFKTLSTAADIAVAMKEIQDVEDSLPDDGANFYAPVGLAHTGSGENNANVWQTNNSAPSTQYQGGTHTHHYTSQEVALKPISTVPFGRDPDFIERGDLLHQISTKLSQPDARVALVGLGGIGKSQLAIEHCYRVREGPEEAWVLWVFASNFARYQQGIREIANTVEIGDRHNPKANIFELVRDWLRRCKKKWTLVLDNVDDASFLFDPPHDEVALKGSDYTSPRLIDYIPRCNDGSILITTRHEEAARKLVHPSNIIAVNPMGLEDAVTLLMKKLRRQADKTDVSELAVALEGMPLAISQAAAYIERRLPRSSPRQYLEKLRQTERRQTSLLDHNWDDLRRDRGAKNSIILTWQISFDYIYQTQSSAADLLSLLSFFDRQAVPDYLIRDYYRRKADATRFNSRNRQEGSKSTQEAESSEFDSNDDDEFEDDVDTLKGFSFISLSTDGLMLEMHRLVQLAVQRWLRTEKTLDKWHAAFIDCLIASFPSGQFETWRECEKLFPHVMAAAVSRKPGVESTLIKWASVLARGLMYALHQGRGKEAERLAIQVMETRKRVLGEEHPSTLTSMGNLASTYSNQGRWKEAEELKVQVMETTKRVLGEEHPDTLTSIGNLAATYWNQGRWKEAEELFVQVMETTKRVLGEEHPDTLTSIANLALTYWNQGRWKEAEELEVQVIETRKRVLGEEHPDTLTSIGNLAATYWNQGQWKEAEELFVQVMETTKRVLGEEHPDTLNSMNNLAVTWRDLGRHQLAIELISLCASLSRTTLGAGHPHTVARDQLSRDWYNERRENE